MLDNPRTTAKKYKVPPKADTDRLVTICVETFDDLYADVQPLFTQHWKELALHQDKVPLNVNYKFYKALDDAGQMLMVAMRHKGDLIGYFFGFVRHHPHYMDMTVLTMDIFWLHPDYRGKGLHGVKLFRFIEAEAKRRGIHTLYYGSKLHKDCGRLFEFLKMEPIETYYSKWIGD